MADLDADLYGDLYENAEDELVVTPATSEQETTFSKPSPATSPTTSTTFAPPPPQQIPTYEEPESTAYRDQNSRPSSIPVSVHSSSVRPSEMKEEGKMFIGGLHWDTTDDGLREYFAQFGKVDACTIMRDPTGRSRCFAFLTFEDPASVNAVMVQEHVLDGKIIDPKRAIPRQEQQRATKLFIGGLAATVTSESMHEFFSQYGKVVDSTVMMDRETGRSKGFGFVSLEEVDVTPFLGFGNLEIEGKLIDVKLAEPRFRRDDDNQNTVGAIPGYGNQQQQGNIGVMNNAFDPQALANLYTRMFQMAGGGMMNVNPMMNMMGAMAGMRGGAMAGRGMMRGGMNMNIPRGARGGAAGGGVPPMGVGPQRGPPRGNHQYHPYSR